MLLKRKKTSKEVFMVFGNKILRALVMHEDATLTSASYLEEF